MHVKVAEQARCAPSPSSSDGDAGGGEGKPLAAMELSARLHATPLWSVRGSEVALHSCTCCLRSGAVPVGDETSRSFFSSLAPLPPTGNPHASRPRRALPPGSGAVPVRLPACRPPSASA
jgi:hypothetical protein